MNFSYSGNASWLVLARSAIQSLAQVLRDEPNAMRVEGYTDDRPIHTLQFNSNWELSAARAASVVHVMIDGGVAPSRLEVVGYGEQQPVADNSLKLPPPKRSLRLQCGQFATANCR